MPPTTNKLYIKRAKGSKGGTVALSKEAARYRIDTQKAVRDALVRLIGFPVDEETVYIMSLDLYFLESELENPNWHERFSRGNKEGQRKAKRRYPPLDYDNRVKWVQDCVFKVALGADDTQIFEGRQRKLAVQNEAERRVVVTVQVGRREDYFGR